MNDVCANYKVEHLYGWTKKGSSGSSSSLILVAVIEEMGAAAGMEVMGQGGWKGKMVGRYFLCQE